MGVSYLEVDLASLAVCDAPLVQDLQQDHRDILHVEVSEGHRGVK